MGSGEGGASTAGVRWCQAVACFLQQSFKVKQLTSQTVDIHKFATSATNSKHTVSANLVAWLLSDALNAVPSLIALPAVWQCRTVAKTVARRVC